MLPLLLFSAFASAQETPAAAPAPVAPVPAAPAVVLFPIRAVNLGAMEVRAAEILFRRRYEAALGAPAISEDATRAAITAADDIGLFAACKQLSCTRWITIDLVRLDQEIYVTVTERDGNAGVTQRIETVAEGLDQLSGTFDRVARALSLHVPLDKVPERQPSSPASVAEEPQAERPHDVDNVENPGAAPGPKDTESLTGFKFGVAGPLWPNFDMSVEHTFTWRREKKDRFFELSAGATIPLGFSSGRQFGMGFLEVGMSYVFPTERNVAFYAGGGFGPRAGGYDAIGIGAGVYVQVGAEFAHKASIRPYAQLKWGGDAFTSSVTPYVVSYAAFEAGVGF